jgi:hypothetical protein
MLIISCKLLFNGSKTTKGNKHTNINIYWYSNAISKQTEKTLVYENPSSIEVPSSVFALNSILLYLLVSM